MPNLGDLIDGKYRLGRRIGEGGMGMVFSAVHEKIGKRLAIKFLLDKHLDNENAIARFQREAQSAAAAGHPGIVDIHDIGVTDEGTPYLVMELLEGRSLAEHLLHSRGRIELPFMAYVTCGVLSALSAAHDHGVIHRDLKPENIFLVDTGARFPEVKLLDFGVSRMRNAAGLPGSMEIPTLTTTGVLMGTPYYMSPEQAVGNKDLDARTDLFTMGIILYEGITGRLPFTGDNLGALVMAVNTQDPPEPSILNPDIDPLLDQIILRALEKDPRNRFADSAEMFHALLPFVPDDVRSAIPVPKSSSFSTIPPSAPEALPPRHVRRPSPAKTSERDAALGLAETQAASYAAFRRKPMIIALVLLALLGLSALAYWSGRAGSPEAPTPEISGDGIVPGEGGPARSDGEEPGLASSTSPTSAISTHLPVEATDAGQVEAGATAELDSENRGRPERQGASKDLPRDHGKRPVDKAPRARGKQAAPPPQTGDVQQGDDDAPREYGEELVDDLEE